MGYDYHKAFDCYSKELGNGNSIVVRLERNENVIRIHPRTVYLPCGDAARAKALELMAEPQMPLMAEPQTTSLMAELLEQFDRVVGFEGGTDGEEFL